jgi:hypothetical protein
MSAAGTVIPAFFIHEIAVINFTKMFRNILLSFLFFFPSLLPSVGQGIVRGKVLDAVNRSAIPFANVVVTGTNTGAVTDTSGRFEITEVKPGFVSLSVSYIGYETITSSPVYVTNRKVSFVEINLVQTAAQIGEVVVRAPLFVKNDEAPLALQSLGIREIERNPGGNRDISKVIQSLPGVASTPSFRNDIIIRGGSPAENKFYLDEIEIPVINHFQTQGASGGPVGIINVDFIREVDLYTGAFPVSKGNALSSVMDIKQIDGNRESLRTRFSIGSSEAGLTIDGPLSPATTYMFSLRRSYLQWLFQAFRLPFLPTFTDLQFKVKHRITDRDEISLIGLGAYDEFELNESVNDDITDPEQLELNNYILGNLPVNTQWNYTTGVTYRHFSDKSVSLLVVSRNELNNRSEKFRNNDNSSDANKILDYQSAESENKIRYEYSRINNLFKWTAGVQAGLAGYTVEGFDNRETPIGPIRVEFDSELDFIQYGAFASLSKKFLNERLSLSLGTRIDGADYSTALNRPWEQFSLRLSSSLALTKKLSWNSYTGNYYQIPSLTILGFSDGNGRLINRNARVTYIRSDHVGSGLQFQPDDASRITLEGYYKKYSSYPFSVRDSISLANLGSDFGVIGNEAVISESEGRAYGVELMLQRRSAAGLYGILVFNWVRSEFSNFAGDYIPSSWDSRLIITATGGYAFGKNWELGLRWRYLSGRPYTPHDTLASSLKSNWDVSAMGVNDYSKLNSLRLDDFHQLDIRIDKSWFYKKWSLNIYLDIQNVYNFKSRERDILNVRTNSSGQPLTDPDDPSRYQIYFIKDETGTVLPSVGVIIDF